MSLRMDMYSRKIILTIPKRISESKALQFALKHQDWINKQIQDLPEAVTFTHGASVPYLGQKHKIIQDPNGKIRGLIKRQNNEIIVPGLPEHCPRRIEKFLKSEAKNIISEMARIKANKLGKTIKSFRFGDPKSRWGSCSSSGTLSFSWRLIMTPEHVVDYVVAHEVSHMEHMNHSPQFWALCEDMIETDISVKTSKKWLRENNKELQRYL